MARLEQKGRVSIAQVRDCELVFEANSQLAGLELSPEWLRQRGVLDPNRNYLANMGIYLFKRDVLLDLLTIQPLATDFGRPQRRARTPPTTAWSTPSSRRSRVTRSSGVRASR